MNVQNGLPFDSASAQPDSANHTRQLRADGHELIERYIQNNRDKGLLDAAEELGWKAYSASQTDDDLYGAHILLAKTLMLKARFRNANYNIDEALKYRPSDQTATELKKSIEQAQQITRAENVPVAGDTHKSHKAPPSRITVFQELSDAGRRDAMSNPRPKAYGNRFVDEGPNVSDAKPYDMSIETIEYEAPPWPDDITLS